LTSTWSGPNSRASDRASYITGQILAVDGGFDAAGIGLPTLRGERRNS